jgi:hypothetical protein
MTDPSLGAPLCLLALASPLLEAGFEVKLVDNLTSPDFENVILREMTRSVWAFRSSPAL